MDEPINSTVSEESVSKSRSSLGLAVVAAVAVVGIGWALLGGDGGRDRSDLGPTANPAADQPRDGVGGNGGPEDVRGPAPTWSEEEASVMTLATAADTAARGDGAAGDGAPGVATGQRLPDRGAFRAALAAALTSSCDALIDGPEPVPTGLYREHGRCVNEALVNLDERCRLAAAVQFVLPSEEVLDVACDIRPESQRYRASVRQSMVIACELQRSAGQSPGGNDIEQDRCLAGIDANLDTICYLSARAQFMIPDDAVLREACEIGADVALGSAVER